MVTILYIVFINFVIGLIRQNKNICNFPSVTKFLLPLPSQIKELCQK